MCLGDTFGTTLDISCTTITLHPLKRRHSLMTTYFQNNFFLEWNLGQRRHLSIMVAFRPYMTLTLNNIIYQHGSFPYWVLQITILFPTFTGLGSIPIPEIIYDFFNVSLSSYYFGCGSIPPKINVRISGSIPLNNTICFEFLPLSSRKLVIVTHRRSSLKES